jgi:ribosomal protein S18 acetylase RimI-like enzyme
MGRPADHDMTLPAREEGLITRLWVKGLSFTRIRRRLVMIERTLSEPAPEISARVPIRVGVLAAGEVDAYLRLRSDQDAVEIRRRLAEGQQCFVAWHERQIIHASWAAPRLARVDYLSAEITLAPDEVYVHGVFTAPAFRGLGASPVCILEMVRYFRTRGCRRLLAVVSPENRSGFRPWEKLGYRRIGLLGFTGLGPWRRPFCLIEPGASPPGRSVPL